MGIYEWLSIALICVVGATTPGPSILVIIYINNTRGFLSGIIASLAHGIGIFCLLYTSPSPRDDR